MLACLVFVPPRVGLSWDETVYVSQVSRHAPAAWFDAARARGVPLLVAPLAWLTSSVVALRVYLTVLSGLGLVLALLVWRRVPGLARDGRPSWVLAVGAVTFGGLWVTQYYGPQAMPDIWSALGSLAAVGFFLRCSSGFSASGSASSSAALLGVGGSVAFVALIRPGDALYLAVPLVFFGLLWRRFACVLAVAGGLVGGGLEWVVEAMIRFGGVFARLHAAGAEQNGFGLHFAVPDELKALNGPTLCRPCTIGYRQPELDLWWLVLPVLVLVGVVVVARAAWLLEATSGSKWRAATYAALPAVCGFLLAAQYLFMINYSAPRFLLPAYAVLAIPVADAIGWLCTGVRSDVRPAVVPVVVVLLFIQVVAQHFVLDHEAGGTEAFHRDYDVVAARLASLGVRPPCTVNGVQYIPIAFVAGCASAPSVGSPPFPAVGARFYLGADGSPPPRYARHWHAYRITGTQVLHVTAYLP